MHDVLGKLSRLAAAYITTLQGSPEVYVDMSHRHVMGRALSGVRGSGSSLVSRPVTESSLAHFGSLLAWQTRDIVAVRRRMKQAGGMKRTLLLFHFVFIFAVRLRPPIEGFAQPIDYVACQNSFKGGRAAEQSTVTNNIANIPTFEK